jgi:hypothetical protein
VLRLTSPIDALIRQQLWRDNALPQRVKCGHREESRLRARLGGGLGAGEGGWNNEVVKGQLKGEDDRPSVS